jgi:hypothetical protein
MVYGTLHQLLEQSKWDLVLAHVDQQQASEPHRRDLPLHMACERGAPEHVLQALLQAHPAATRHQGRGDNLCLHVATHRKLPEAILEALIREYPEALDMTNAANLTPRDLGHDYPNMRRPTMCWHQLIQDERIEEDQEERLHSMHARVDAAIAELETSTTLHTHMSRLEHIDTRLKELETMRPSRNMSETVQKLQMDLQNGIDKMDQRMTTVEDDVQAASAREFIAKAASRAQQSHVLRLQKRAADEVKKWKMEVESVKNTMLI